MPYYTVSKVFPSDKTTMASVKNLLHQEGIRNVDSRRIETS
ncbi:hypothetical protein [Streptococcus pyogenes]